MIKTIKSVVLKENTLDLLDIRLGRVIEVSIEPSSPKRAYKMLIDFGKFGTKTSIGRFTNHSEEEMKGSLILGVLNFEPRKIGDIESQVLVLGVQFPKTDSGEATFLTPSVEAKIGSKVF